MKGYIAPGGCYERKRVEKGLRGASKRHRPARGQAPAPISITPHDFRVVQRRQTARCRMASSGAFEGGRDSALKLASLERSDAGQSSHEGRPEWLCEYSTTLFRKKTMVPNPDRVINVLTEYCPDDIQMPCSCCFT